MIAVIPVAMSQAFRREFSELKASLQKNDAELLEVKKDLAARKIEIASMKADYASKTTELLEQIAELSHPLESLIVGAIVDEVLNHCYFFENGSWQHRLPLFYKPKSATWKSLGIPKALLINLKEATVRNVSCELSLTRRNGFRHMIVNRPCCVQEFAHPWIGAYTGRTLAPIIKAQHPLSHREYWPLLKCLDALRKRHGPFPQGDRRALPSLTFPPGHAGFLDSNEVIAMKKVVPMTVLGLNLKAVTALPVAGDLKRKRA